MKNPIVTLLTDFGTKDHYVASIKGVILRINPLCTLIDITHQIKPQDVEEGAFVLASAFSYFPKGTIHLAVVDPEVGGPRDPILIVTDHFFFVGPDNGLFSLVLHKEKVKEAFKLTENRFFLPKVSDTFHGRDLFAPVAGHLALGISPKAFGRRIDSWKTLEFQGPLIEKKSMVGKVVHIDSFGNLITNIEEKNLGYFVRGIPFHILIGKRRIEGIQRGYWEAERGDLLALIGSSGLLEISVNEGNAQKVLKVKRGDPIRIQLK